MPNPSVNNSVGQQDGSIRLYTWILTTADPDGTPVEVPEWADMTWVIGDRGAGDTFGGATVALQGFNDVSQYGTSASYITLSNAAGGASATGSSAKIMTTIENPRFVAPRLTVVGAGATISVSCLVRRATGMRQ